MQMEVHNSNNKLQFKSQALISSAKYHSILPDLATGWRPKNAKISAPILITYEDKLSQLAFQSSVACLSKLVYIGARHDNSYKFHSLVDHSYNIKYGIKCQQVPTKLQKQLEEFTLKNNNRNSLFEGMNPMLTNQLQFQANFQCGNLDFVTKVSPTQYNLFLRPDTNTQGHMQWFYFRLSNSFYPHSKIKINIYNNRKKDVLYCRGMKPYVYSKYLQKSKGIKWQQGGENIQYVSLSQKQQVISHFPKFEQFQSQLLQKYYCLSFDYSFESPNDQVYFAYCPPFTYSQMKGLIQTLKKKSNSNLGVSIVQQNLCFSLSGLQIPILTITDETIQNTDKKCVIVTSRFHPGQSNGSYVLKGFLQYLISPDADLLRRKLVFKIIPMINPDGVVFGNYRTSLSGKDLNRKFKAKNIELFPQIIHFKQLINKLKKQSEMKLLYFLDFHGHSMKKNVFVYGPQYDIWSQKFDKSKILPRTIATKTEMFRYQSCLFRVAATKKTTARAFMLGFAPYCYTIQSSVGMFRSFDSKQNILFQPIKWQSMGRIIAESLRDIVQLNEKQFVNPKKKKKNIVKIQFQNKQNFNQKQNSIKKQNCEQNIKQRSCLLHSANLGKLKNKSKQKIIQKISSAQKEYSRRKSKELELQETSRTSSSKSNRQRKSVAASMGNGINHTLSQTKLTKSPSTYYQFQYPQIQEVDGESDGYSQGKSDCESDDNDFNKQQYQKISGTIIKFIQNFNSFLIGKNPKNFRLRNKKKKPKVKNSIIVNKMSISTNQEMKMVPSLKHKLLQRDFSQKRILSEDKQQQMIKTKKLSICKIQEQRKK